LELELLQVISATQALRVDRRDEVGLSGQELLCLGIANPVVAQGAISTFVAPSSSSVVG
jgi:hypothetical protein